MSTQDNGGPAFPYEHKEWDRDDQEWRTQYVHEGMTLRDYLAAKAMQGLLAWNAEGTKGIGALAYQIADEMLAARAGEDR